MLEKILLYNVKNPQHIIKAASNMRIICGFINESDTDRTLAEIATDVRGISLSDAEKYQPQENKESLVIFCDVTDKHMDTKYSGIPVVSGMTDYAHPLQVLTDLMTVRERKGTLAGLKAGFVGDGYNMANSVIVGCLAVGMTVTVACPRFFM